MLIDVSELRASTISVFIDFYLNYHLIAPQTQNGHFAEKSESVYCEVCT